MGVSNWKSRVRTVRGVLLDPTADATLFGLRDLSIEGVSAVGYNAAVVVLFGPNGEQITGEAKRQPGDSVNDAEALSMALGRALVNFGNALLDQRVSVDHGACVS